MHFRTEYGVALRHIDDLRVFAQVVDSGTLAAAGRVLGLSPTLTSRRLARLENTVGVRLIERTTRRLRVTDEGRRFYARCRRVLGELELAEAELVPAEGAVVGTVRAVLPSSMLAYGLLDGLRSFLAAHAGLTVELHVNDQPVGLLAGGWDVATHVGRPADSTHIARRIGFVSPHLAATAEYLARAGIPEVPSDLAQHQCLRFGPDRSRDVWPVIDSDGVTHRVPLGGQMICRDIMTLFAAMRAGLGIGLLPRLALLEAIDEGALVQVLPGCRIDGNPLYALMPANRHRVPRVRAFVDWLAGWMAEFELVE